MQSIQIGTQPMEQETQVTGNSAVLYKSGIDRLSETLAGKDIMPQLGMSGVITLDLDQDDLINMLKGVGPNDSMADAGLAKWSGGLMTARYDWDLGRLKEMSISKLYDLYNEAKHG